MPVIVLAVLVAFFSIACPDSFLTLYNLKTILNQLSITLIIALGITFVILTGSVDLSVDGVVGLAGSLVSVLVMNSKYATNLGLLGVLLSILAGVACGMVSGLIHVRMKISSFMVTYAMCAIAKGFAVMSYDDEAACCYRLVLLSVPAWLSGNPRDYLDLCGAGRRHGVAEPNGVWRVHVRDRNQ